MHKALIHRTNNRLASRSCLGAIFLVVALLGTSSAMLFADDAAPAGLTLHFPTPLVLEQLWTYQLDGAISGSERRLLFWVGGVPDNPGAHGLVITTGELLAGRNFQRLLTGPSIKDTSLLYDGDAPPREVAFFRLDLDGDSKDEVVLIGRGGAGGTSFLKIFKVSPNAVTVVFYDASRFGFDLFDDGTKAGFKIANPGFDWVANGHLLEPKEFKIYTLGEKEYVRTSTVKAEEFQATLATMVETGTGGDLRYPVVRLHVRQKRLEEK